jgi:AP-1-like transcription factor
MVSQDHVDAALKKLGKKDEQGKFQNPQATDIPPLMFEQESWDNVLRKLGGGGAAS